MGSDTISLDNQRRLLLLARECLDARVRRLSRPPVGRGGALDESLGAFVTIHHAGELRGCLGRLDVSDALATTVAHLAGAVADSDSRFPPVRLDELDGITIEISVLTPERDVTNVEEIEVGRHGLIVEQGRHRGLLLPQVATEQRWDRVTFLAHTCLKAGLSKDAWREGARILMFEAQVFGDSSSDG